MDVEMNSYGKKKPFLVLSVLLLMTASIASSYGGAIVLPGKLTEIGAMDYYPLCSASSSMGMMLALPLVGVLGSKFGIKAITIFGIIVQLIARIGLMFASNIVVFDIIWTINGAASGLYISAPYAIMADIVTEKERPRFYGLLATFSALGALAGPAITGIAVDWGSTNYGLIIYFIFAIIPLIGLTMIPNKKRPGSGKFDLKGIVLLVVAVCCIVMWLSLGGKMFAFFSPVGIAMLAVGIVFAILLIAVERKQANPSVPIHMFKKKRFRTTFLISMLMVAYGTCVGAFAIVYVQQVMGGTATISSTVTMPQTIVQAILGLFIGSIVGRSFKKNFRPAALIALLSYAVALGIFSILQPNSSMFIIYLATALGGIGQAISQSQFAPFFQSELKLEEFSAAQGMYQFGSTGGSCIFTAVCGACITMGWGYNQIFMLGTSLVVVALLIGIVGFRFSKEEINAASAAEK